MAFILLLSFATDFTKVDQWVINQEVTGFYNSSVIDPDGELIANFWKDPVFITNKKGRFESLRPMGNGPADIISAGALSFRGKELTVIGHQGKIQHFIKKNGSYELKGLTTLEPSKKMLMYCDAAWVGDKFLIAGMRSKRPKLHLVRAYDQKGSWLEDVVTVTLEESTVDRPRYELMRFYLELGRRLYFMPEYEMKVTVIDPKSLKTLAVHDLEKPDFYRRMPDNIYVKEVSKDFYTNVFHWTSNYNRINAMTTVEDYLVVQVRDIRPGQPNYWVGIYDTEQFRLKKQVRTNDLLLDASGNRLYMFKNGDPIFDEVRTNPGPLTINIYELKP